MTAQEIIARRARGAYPAQRRPAAPDTAGEGKRVEKPKGRSPFMTQTILCAILFAVIVGVKLTMPDVTARYREQVLDLMGETTDAAAVFSAVGQLMGPDARQAAEQAYEAVFGAQSVEAADHTADRNAAVYSLTNTPARTELLQQILGFDYTDPVEGRLSSAFGYRDHPITEREKFHYGLDITAPEGAVISAFAAGEVAVVAESSELGKYVELVHENGYSTLYAHCSRVTASAGQTVKPGDPIAEVGATGEATGSHLHFELHRDNVYLNPIYYVTC